MSKDPAFLFYPNDYIGGTMGMTFEEKGAYMELLMLQFNRGHMSGHMIGQTVGQLFGRIKDKFKVDADGLYYNQRLDDEIAKRQNFVSSRKNNISGVNQYTKKTRSYDPKMTSHMENENINVNTNVITKKRGAGGKQFIKPNLDEIISYCKERNNSISAQAFLDFYESNGWKVGQNKMVDWKATLRGWEKREAKTQSKPKYKPNNIGNFKGRDYADDELNGFYEQVEVIK